MGLFCFVEGVFILEINFILMILSLSLRGGWEIRIGKVTLHASSPSIVVVVVRRGLTLDRYTDAQPFIIQQQSKQAT